MGTFNWPVLISSVDGEHSREIDATVDTGATYTVLPSRLLRELGVPVRRQARFELADGRILNMDIGQAWATINGTSVVTQVVFGADDAAPLLGAYTLEGLLLAVDPVGQRLVPTNAILYWAAGAGNFDGPARQARFLTLPTGVHPVTALNVRLREATRFL